MAKGDAALQQLQDFLDEDTDTPQYPGTVTALLEAEQAEQAAFDADEGSLTALQGGVTRLSPGRLAQMAQIAANQPQTGRGAPAAPASGGTVVTPSEAPATGAPTPQRAAALRAGRVPGQAQADAEARRQQRQLEAQQAAQQKQLTTQITTAAQTSVNRVSDTVGYVHDRVANAPAPPPGSIWLLVAAQILLILLIFPVNGVPRIGWLWLVLTRQATLAGTDVGGAPVTAQQEEAAVEGVFSTLTGVATTAEGAAAGAAAGAVGAIETWGEGIGARIARYIP